MINHEKAQNEALTKEKIKARTYEAYAIAQHIYEQNKAACDKTEIRQMILDALRPTRFEKGIGYYFATRLDGVVMLFADKPEKEGLNLLDMQDTHGKYVIKDMIEIAGQVNEGFYEYHWTKPAAEGNDFKKIAFIKRFEPLDWYIGTGLYVADVESLIKKQVMEQINRIHFGENGYFFVDDWQGISLAHGAQPNLVGTNMWEAEDSKGNKTTQMLIAASKEEDGGYVSYWWRKPATGKESPKIAHAKGVPDWELFVGTGVYLDDVETEIALMQSALNRQLKAKMRYFSLLIVGLIALFLFLSNFLNRKFKNDFNLFISFFNKAAHADQAINRDAVKFIEFDRMAKNANKMLRDKIHARQELLDERERLFVTIRSIGDAVIATDTTGRVELMNTVAEGLTGWKLAEAQGKPLIEVFSIVNAKTREPAPMPANPFSLRPCAASSSRTDLRSRRSLQPLGKISSYNLEPAFDRLAATVRSQIDMKAIYRLLGL
ncbi:MAG: cache domain-containing protein [Patescibacteria group bacterium]|nr:cache domain-containing protein [Patescibacteria group bacterium]